MALPKKMEGQSTTKVYPQLGITIRVSYIGIEGPNRVWMTHIVDVEPWPVKYYRPKTDRCPTISEVAADIADYHAKYGTKSLENSKKEKKC